jgi:hypothetical protein
MQNIEEYLRYEPETGKIFWIKARKKVVVGNRAGKINKALGYEVIGFNLEKLYSHRVAWRLYYGVWPDKNMLIDHINGDKSDNRIDNLRLSTKSQNAVNSGMRKNNTTGFKGVSLDKRRGKYVAEITKDNKKIHLGMFDTPKEASNAYI